MYAKASRALPSAAADTGASGNVHWLTELQDLKALGLRIQYFRLI